MLIPIAVSLQAICLVSRLDADCIELVEDGGTRELVNVVVDADLSTEACIWRASNEAQWARHTPAEQRQTNRHTWTVTQQNCWMEI